MVQKLPKILDASVIIKWIVKEEKSEEAYTYLDEYQKGFSSLIVPNLLFYEIGNTLLSKGSTTEQATEAIDMLSLLQLLVVDITRESFPRIFDDAKSYKISFYDATYVFLMDQQNCPLITADKKLYQKIHEAFPSASLL